MRTFYAVFTKVEAILAGALLIAMVGLIFLGGVARMLGHPLNWTIDFATCFIAWAVLLCADVAWRRDALMSIDIVSARLPARARRALFYVNHAIIAAFLVYVIHAGIVLTSVSRSRSFQGIPEISYAFVTASLPVGGALLLLTTLVRVVRRLREDGVLRPSTAGARS